jgi:TPP-dependent pyruvate/acetoin dehydrogenase alpha subunit
MGTWTSKSLKAFEEKIAELFNQGKIFAPVHLSDGSEDSLIEIFKEVNDEDWIFCSWRSHYQCLLKGVKPEALESEIIAGRSIALCFPSHNVYSSAIVAGQIPIAVGAALSLKRLRIKGHVWCFIGDMTSETGMAQTAIRYSEKHNLPITYVIEDNGISVLTETRKVWNTATLRFEESINSLVKSFKYKSKYPHAGAGKRVQF